MSGPAEGDEAPDFELQDQERQPVRLSSFRGRKHVVVVFYPMSFTPTFTLPQRQEIKKGRPVTADRS